MSALDIELKTNTYNITNNLGVSGGTEGKVLTAGAEATFGLSKDSIGLKGSAMASGATELFGLGLNLSIK